MRTGATSPLARSLASSSLGLHLWHGFFGTTPPHPDTWLVESEQELLAEAMSGFEGWVAGCLLESLDEAPLRRPRGQRADYEVELESGRRDRLVNVKDITSSGSYNGVLGDASDEPNRKGGDNSPLPSNLCRCRLPNVHDSKRRFAERRTHLVQLVQFLLAEPIRRHHDRDIPARHPTH